MKFIVEISPVISANIVILNIYIKHMYKILEHIYKILNIRD